MSSTESNIKPTTSARWQSSLKQAFRNRWQLMEFLELDPKDAPLRLPFADGPEAKSPGDSLDEFPMLVTREYANRMRRGDWSDPLLRQVWIDPRESLEEIGFDHDPVGDQHALLAPGLLQKYHGRVLLIATGACAIHCRYCFRRHYPYAAGPRSLDDWQTAIERIESDDSIDEVILSGGDPLTIADSTLARLVSRIERIGHVERLRIHTRVPVVLPSRVCPELLDWLGATRLSKWIVLHMNHAQEIDSSVAQAVNELRSVGAMILNQAVLLRDINDTVEAQESLCRRLLQISVLPYYLNQLDRVEGAAHFETKISLGKSIVAELARRLPGYAVPRFVQEQSGQAHKTRID